MPISNQRGGAGKRKNVGPLYSRHRWTYSDQIWRGTQSRGRRGLQGGWPCTPTQRCGVPWDTNVRQYTVWHKVTKFSVGEGRATNQPGSLSLMLPSFDTELPDMTWWHTWGKWRILAGRLPPPKDEKFRYGHSALYLALPMATRDRGNCDGPFNPSWSSFATGARA